MFSKSPLPRSLTNQPQLIIIPARPTVADAEQGINNVLMVKTFLEQAMLLYEALASVHSELLQKIRDICCPEKTRALREIISEAIHDDVTYVKAPRELRHQRTFAVKVRIQLSSRR